MPVPLPPHPLPAPPWAPGTAVDPEFLARAQQVGSALVAHAGEVRRATHDHGAAAALALVHLVEAIEMSPRPQRDARLLALLQVPALCASRLSVPLRRRVQALLDVSLAGLSVTTPLMDAAHDARYTLGLPQALATDRWLEWRRAHAHARAEEVERALAGVTIGSLTGDLLSHLLDERLLSAPTAWRLLQSGLGGASQLLSRWSHFSPDIRDVLLRQCLQEIAGTGGVAYDYLAFMGLRAAAMAPTTRPDWFEPAVLAALDDPGVSIGTGRAMADLVRVWQGGAAAFWDAVAAMAPRLGARALQVMENRQIPPETALALLRAHPSAAMRQEVGRQPRLLRSPALRTALLAEGRRLDLSLHLLRTTTALDDPGETSRLLALVAERRPAEALAAVQGRAGVMLPEGTVIPATLALAGLVGDGDRAGRVATLQAIGSRRLSHAAAVLPPVARGRRPKP